MGLRHSEALLPILRDSLGLDRYIAARPVGTTASSLTLGASTLSATVTLMLPTSTQVVLGELIPKPLALNHRTWKT